MKTYLECIPCFLRQALESARLVTDDTAVHERLLRSVLQAASEMDLRQSPPAMGQRIHRMIRSLIGDDDPYREMKNRSTRLALRLYPELKARVDTSAHPLETALRLAIAGNVIDMGVNARFDESHLHEAIEDSLSAELDGDVHAFIEAVTGARDILYLADNAGEIVFDKLLLERMPAERITVAVRGFPVINDATLVDARAAGIPELAEVIDNSSDAPGTILGDCCDKFRRRFDQADLIVAKGQGNYETLNEVERDIFFVLKAKCPVIARDLGCRVGSLILRRSTDGRTTPFESDEIESVDPVDVIKE